MNDLMKLRETESDTIYMIESDMQGLVSVPKKLQNNIKVFMMFGNNNNENQNKLLEDISIVSKQINSNNDEGLCIIAFISSEILTTNNAITYTRELNRIKELVNSIYNKILKEHKLTKENFVKKIELLYSDERYKDFMDFLCLQNPNKFHTSSYQELVSKTTQSDTSSNNKDLETTQVLPRAYTNQFVVSDNYNQVVTQPNNVTPIAEKLSIGNAQINQYSSDNSESGGPSNSNIENKTLTRTIPTNHGNAAFINLTTIILILIISLVIGISFSIYVLR